jgi:GNAT superfamily N-acetyltransferase
MVDFQIREARIEDFDSLMALYRQLLPNDPVLTDGADLAVFKTIVDSPNLHLFVAAASDGLVGSIYLNIVPNITRSASPYAVIENVITRDDLRGKGIGKSLMAHTLTFAWDRGCYKAMLQTGSKQESTHAFYRSCGFTTHEKTGFLARPS